MQAKVSYHLEQSGMSYKSNLQIATLVLGLEVPRRGQTVNHGWLLLVPEIGLLVRDTENTEARCCLFERFWQSLKHEPRKATDIEKSLK